MKNLLYRISGTLLICFLITALMGSCKKPEGPDGNNTATRSTLEIKKRVLGFKPEGGTLECEINASESWKFEIIQGKEWIKADKKNETNLVVTVAPSNQNSARKGKINITIPNGEKRDIRVTQMGLDLQILIDDPYKNITIPAEGEEQYEVPITSNTTYKIVIPEDAKDWVTEVEQKQPRAELVTHSHYFKITKNTSPSERSTTLKVISTLNDEISNQFTFVQKNSTGDPAEVKIIPDTKIPVQSGLASEHQPGSGDIENSFDGIFNGQAYHSRWGNGTVFPVTLEYFLADTDKVLDYIIYHTRNGNGNFGKFELFTATSTGGYEQIGTYDFQGAGGNHTIKIEHPRVVKKVKFIVHSGLNNFVSCDEMEFFHKETNPLNSKLTRVFSDISCMEIKPEATQEDIDALPEFFRLLATSIKEKSYPEDEKRFRMQEYQAFSTPEYWSQKLRINSYTHLNNPTGIVTNAQETMIVLVSGLGNNFAYLRCNPGIGIEGDQILLKEGINKIRFNRSGNLFVIYEAPDPRELTPIRVHFPPQVYSGKEHARVGWNVWDLAMDKTDAVYHKYLEKETDINNETGPIFILKGEKILFTVNKNLLRNQRNHKSRGVLQAINRWDEIMGWEQELSAIESFRKSGEFNDLMHVTTHKDGLYATSYYINMASGDPAARDGWGFKNNFDPRDQDAAQDNQWGVGHELGHMHQGAINWPSTTESSNNLFSNYIVYKIGKWGSRGSSIETLAKRRYAPPTPWVRFMHPRAQSNSENEYAPQNMEAADANKYGLYQGEDSEMHMRLNQQLWNYFERAGYQPGFIHKIFEQGRTPRFWIPWGDPGKAQLIYAENVAAAANMDMTEFFDTYGFFIPVKEFTLHAYGGHRYVVTEEMINKTKEYMKTFPKKCPPIEYIEDRKYSATAPGGNAKEISRAGGDVGFYTTFRDKVQITKNVTYSVNGRSFTVRNGDQAVAFELRKNNERIWFSNRYSFQVPDIVDIEGAELYAVQYDGVRKKATKQ